MRMSICFPNGLQDFRERSKNGRFDYTFLRHESEVLAISLYEQALNATKIYYTESVEKCLSLTEDGAVDFVLTTKPIYNYSKHYNVPFATGMSYLNILSGYDHISYLNTLSKGISSELGILSNYKGFENTVYLILFLLLFTFFIFASVCSLVDKERKIFLAERKCRNGKRIRFSKLLKLTIEKTMSVKNSRRRFFSYLAIIASFLIMTPFLLMFKTNQVIVPPPVVIKNFDEIIKSGAKIYFTDTSDDPEKFFDEIGFDTVSAYYRANRVNFELPNFPDKFKAVNQAVINIVDKKSVFLVPRIISTIIYQLLCSFTYENQLFKIKRYRSENSREFIIGQIFRVNFTDPIRLRNYVATFETGLQQLEGDRFFVGFGVLGTSASHTREQRILCYENEIEKMETSGEYYGNVKLFSKFFYICFFMCILATFILAIECNLGKNRRVRNY